MYSILIKTGDTTYIYAVTKDAVEQTVIFSGNEAETNAFYAELLEQYPSSQLVVIHNVEVTSELTLTDVTEQGIFLSTL